MDRSMTSDFQQCKCLVILSEVDVSEASGLAAEGSL